MRIWFLSLLCFGILQAAQISTPLLEVQNDQGTIESADAQVGMSGFVVRHFDALHSAIISDVRVSEVNPANHRVIITFSPFNVLRQNALPHGNWTPKANDEVVLAHDYGRAMLITPNDDSYLALTQSIPSLEWSHPDLFATYLSRVGHPTPLIEDFKGFCTFASVGLLYIQSANTLFTLDCKNFALLNIAPSKTAAGESVLPFYSRVPTIRSAWWGEGSSRLEHYDPYYLQQLAIANPLNQTLYTLYKNKFGANNALLDYFKIKE